MRALALLIALTLAAPARADTALSAEIGATGIAATAARLAALPAPTADDRFALAGLRFLGGVERALQLRWQTGVRADWSELPILRLPIPENPAPRPFAGADIVALLDGVVQDMDAARAALDGIGTAEVGVEIRLADLWFDIDGNGARSDGEDLGAVAGATLAGVASLGFAPVPDPVIRFDGADAEWLRAYTHLLAGFAEAALAFDPAPAVDRVIADVQAMQALWGDVPPPNALDMMFGRQADRILMILTALETRPDPARAAAARAHLLQMIASNRRFWTMVAAETDNDREWIPNDAQSSGLGLTVPPGTGPRWLAVLSDAEAVLQGRLLMPHWRYGGGAGIDVAAMFADPPPLDLVGMIQGGAFLPYARQGPRVGADNWRQFARLVQGDAGLFALLLN